MRTHLLVALVFGMSGPAFGDCADELDGLIGYTIIDVKTVEGWRDDDEADDSSFNGCSHGRIIIFTDGTYLTCAEYGYQYAYRPEAVIFGKSVTYQGHTFTDFKMLVEDEVYDMRQ